MADTISPSVTSRVPRSSDAVCPRSADLIRRHGGPRRSDHHQQDITIVDGPLVAAHRCDDPIHPTTKAVGFLRGFDKQDERNRGPGDALWPAQPCDGRHGWGVLIDVEEDGTAHGVRDLTDGPARPGDDSVTVRRPYRGQGRAIIARPIPPPTRELRLRRYPRGMERDEERTHFTTTEAAALLGITQQGVHSAIRRGHLQTELVNPRLRLIPRRAIEAYRRDRLGQVGRPPRTGQRTDTETTEADPTPAEEPTPHEI